VIITGHRDDASDRVVGLEFGADYVSKPSLRELLARIRAVCDRGKPGAQQHSGIQGKAAASLVAGTSIGTFDSLPTPTARWLR
jgi:DNA-binding response OmpR family regulator